MANLENLKVRAGVLRTIRAFFDARGFVEVETPTRIPAPAPEPHIDCPASGDWFLRASPELQMKKLLAAGLPRLYQIGPCFREGERGRRHSPEFTMLEWYRAEADYTDIARDMEELVRAILWARGSAPLPFARLTVREAYIRWAGWDPVEDWNQDRFDFDMATKIEPNLPKGPLFLTDYPAPAASLARLRADDPRVAERWELYVDGMEIANAFTELTDSVEQRKRFEAARAERRVLGEADYPLDEDFLSALARMPPAGGVALGVDRLVMLACGAASIDEVRVES
ncbi:MAG: EF-P lysine aminoacylase GenX [Kiritimatiellae bacterium]|nr:EF-P lysine aminoacylase GenX [Kiritimatiellia bacterium]